MRTARVGLAIFLLALLAVVSVRVVLSPWPITVAASPTDAASALAELRAGNRRFINSARVFSVDTAHDAQARAALLTAQHPFAAVLCCSDSRVIPEFIFDQGPGRIFEIRNAGNVVDEDVMASIEYAIEHLHVRLVVVMGHTGCGAIRAVHEAGERALPDHLSDLQRHMSGLRQLHQARPGEGDEDLIDRLCRENAHQQADWLRHECRVLRKVVAHHEVQLMDAIYNMKSGAVEFLHQE
jgi:carbonic anhydrase